MIYKLLFFYLFLTSLPLCSWALVERTIIRLQPRRLTSSGRWVDRLARLTPHRATLPPAIEPGARISPPQ